MSEKKHILITGGAGYIGSLLASELLRAGNYVTVVDNLLYGGESLLGFLAHPDFHFTKADVTEPGSVRPALSRDWPKPEPWYTWQADCWVPSLSGDRKAGCLAAQRRGRVKRVYEQVSWTWDLPDSCLPPRTAPMAPLRTRIH